MNTREQRLRELVSKWRSGQNYYFAKSVSEKCADELAAILAEPVEVSEEMVDRACMANLNPLAEPSETERKHMRASLHAALNIKEPGQ